MEILISTPPYATLYHQLMLLVSVAGLAIAVRMARRPRPERYIPHQQRVLVLGFAGVFLCRLAPAVLPVVALWAQPVERVADIVGLALLIWMLVPAFHHRKWPARLWLATAGALSVAYLGVTALADTRLVLPPTHYNLTPPAYLWAIWQVVATVAAIMGLALFNIEHALDTRPKTRSLLLLALGTLLIGYDFHLLTLAGALPHYPLPDNVAGWVRCAQIIAYPVSVGALYCSCLFTDSRRREP